MTRRSFSRSGALLLLAGLLGSTPIRAEVQSAQLVQQGADFASGSIDNGLSLLAGGLYAARETIYVSSVLEAGLTFSAIGPHWQGAPDAALELRVSPDGDRWSRWIAVPHEATIAPLREDGQANPFAGQALGALVFVEPGSRFLQYRVQLRGGPPGVAGLSLIAFQVIDPGAREEGGAPAPLLDRLEPSEAPDSPGFVTGAAHRAVAPPPEIPTSTWRVPKPPIVSRAAWGARPPKAGYSYTLARHLGFHHTGTVEDWSAETREECAARMRAIQTYHMDTNGWNDIGYAWTVCKHGHIFQAREDDDDSTDVHGAHDGLNRGSTGISSLGYFHPPVDHQPTAAMVSSLVDLMSWLASLRGIDPLGRSLYEAFGAPVDNVYGHREVKATDCPGDHLYALKEFLRTAVSDRVIRILY